MTEEGRTANRLPVLLDEVAEVYCQAGAIAAEYPLDNSTPEERAAWLARAEAWLAEHNINP